ncbi:ribosomal protein S5 domain 2-type protein [Lipomyces japonicus]|uniref:ribosomal protein S5 domain 2-type protein n=1 Tax=Lipomyces japonicus TaxID=56871 RepID=UPI0034CFF30A
MDIDHDQTKYEVLSTSNASTKTALLFRADGSASWKVGNAHLIASVSGPLEVLKKDEQPTVATIELVVRPHIGVTSTTEQYIQDRIRKVISPLIILELHPRTLIQIVIQIIQSGDLRKMNTLALSAGINATYMALLDGGIPLRSTVSACSLIHVQQQDGSNLILVDPNLKELQSHQDNIRSVHTFAYEIKTGKIERLLLSESTGKFTSEELFDFYDRAADICVRTNLVMRRSIIATAEKQNRWKETGHKIKSVNNKVRKQ